MKEVNNLKNAEIAVCITLVCITVIGGIAMFVHPYSYDLSAQQNGDVVDYEFSANYPAETTTLLIETDGSKDIKKAVIFFDKDYGTVGNWYMQDRIISFLENHFAMRSVDTVRSDAAEAAEFMSTEVPSETVFVFTTGSFPDTIYDGTCGCTLIHWLEDGGSIVNIGGTLGKHISHSGTEELTETSGYAELFTGTCDDSMFMDSDRYLYTSDVYDSRTNDALKTYFNEYTYGINTNCLTDYIELGCSTADGWSSCTLFKSHNGMVMNVGMSTENGDYLIDAVAQTIAAGMDYTAVVHSVANGKADTHGHFTIPAPGHYHIYGYAGSTRAVFGEKIIL